MRCNVLDIDTLLREIKQEIKPKPEDYEKVKSIIEPVIDNIRKFSSKYSEVSEVSLQGSLAKDTWIRGETDVDIFILFKPETERDILTSLTRKIAHKVFGVKRCKERFAEHPYITIEDFRGFRIDIVPCYKVPAGNLLSPTDRTPHHTRFIKEHFDEQLKDEARLLKKFTKGIDVYGAEIKKEGFSGFLCELLVLAYRSFMNVLERFSSGQLPIIVDLLKYYEDPSILPEVFKSQFVVVDPVDRRRNVAAAVSPTRLSEFIAASQTFLTKPSKLFFYVTPFKPKKPEILFKELERNQRSIVGIMALIPVLPPDILWGELKKALRIIVNRLKLEGFKVVKSSVWSDEREYSIFLIELESRYLSRYVKRRGPPVTSSHSLKFAQLYGPGSAISGPWIENNRWFILAERKWVDSVKFLEYLLSSACIENLGLPADLLSLWKSSQPQIFPSPEVASLAVNENFSRFLDFFVDGRPRWLRISF